MAYRRREISRDGGLRWRMWFVMSSLVLLYVFFVLALMLLGVNPYFVGIIAVGMALIQYFGSDKLVLRSMGAKEVTPEQEPKLHAVVDRLVALAEMPKPKLAVAHTDIPNAFATGRSPKNSVVCVTTGIMNRLNDEELEAVLAHELAHIKNRDVRVMTLASFFATVAAMLMQILMWVSLLGGMGGHRGGRGGGGSGDFQDFE